MTVPEREMEYQPRRWEPPPRPAQGRMAWVAAVARPKPNLPRVPGLIEIKPHTATSRPGGLKQLRDNHARPQYAGHDKWFVTYQALDAGGRPVVRGRAHQVQLWARRFEGGNPPNAQLTDAYDLGIIPVPTTTAFPRVDLPGFFGSAIEEPIRTHLTRLLEMKQRRVDQRTGGAAPGPDLLWAELAAMYSELAEELRDPFYAELATELSRFAPQPNAEPFAGAAPGR